MSTGWVAKKEKEVALPTVQEEIITRV